MMGEYKDFCNLNFSGSCPVMEAERAPTLGTISGWSPAMEAEGASQLWGLSVVGLRPWKLREHHNSGHYQWLVSCHGRGGSIATLGTISDLSPAMEVEGPPQLWALSVVGLLPWKRREHHNSGRCYHATWRSTVCM